jgi:hypothetical protein
MNKLKNNIKNQFKINLKEHLVLQLMQTPNRQLVSNLNSQLPNLNIQFKLDKKNHSSLKLKNQLQVFQLHVDAIVLAIRKIVHVLHAIVILANQYLFKQYNPQADALFLVKFVVGEP